jgi:hypothetical protein
MMMAKPTYNTDDVTLGDLLRRPDAIEATKALRNFLNRNGITVKFESSSPLFGDENARYSFVCGLAGVLSQFNAMLDRKLNGLIHIEDLGFEGIKQNADYSEELSALYLSSDGKGEWCRFENYIFVNYDGVLDVISAFLADGEVHPYGRDIDRDRGMMALKLLEYTDRR